MTTFMLPSLPPMRWLLLTIFLTFLGVAGARADEHEPATSPAQDMDAVTAPSDQPNGAMEPPAAEPKQNSSGLLKVFKKAVKDRNWTLAAGAALMLVVMLLRKLKPGMIPGQFAPYAAAIMASGPTIALAFMDDSGEVPIDELLATFASIYFMSGGMFSMPATVAGHVAGASWYQGIAAKLQQFFGKLAGGAATTVTSVSVVPATGPATLVLLRPSCKACGKSMDGRPEKATLCAECIKAELG